MSPQTVGIIGRSYIDQCRVEDFQSHIEQQDEISSLTEEQYHRLCTDPIFPNAYRKRSTRTILIGSITGLCFGVAKDLVQEYLEENEEAEEQ